jgi:4-hydroxy-tetrahydrodipicolinate synthase
LIDHFTQLADLSAKPLVLYDIPYRTGVRFDLDTLLTLAAHPQIQAIKDCAGSNEITQALIADGRLQVLAGEDLNIFNTLCMGGSGAIAASAHIRPDLFNAMFRSVCQQKLERARAIFHTLAPFMRILFAESNPAPVKAALALQGLMLNELRPPMSQATPGLIERLQQGLFALDQSAAQIEW